MTVRLDSETMSATRRSLDLAFERLAAVDSRLWAGVFFGVVGLYTLAVVIEVTSYSSDARLFPLLVGIPLLGLIAMKLALLLVGDRLHLESMELFDIDEDLGGAVGADVAPGIRYRREFVMILWLVGLSAFLWAFGFLPALLVFLLTFVVTYERSLARAAVVALGTFAFVYLFFIRLLGATIYGGVFTIGIPGITS